MFSRFLRLTIGLSLATLTCGVQAQSNAVPSISNEQFSQCIAALQVKANEVGIDPVTNKEVLGNARFLPKIISYDRNQPEFVQSFASYLHKRVNDWRIKKGRQLLKENSELLRSLTQQYGIPAHYLVAFWGLETNFGSYKGKMPIIDSLATLACDTRRSEFFSKELLLALKLYDRENLNVETMVGSWAGAMGHTQFMPSAYLQYAVDGDGDGKVNLWNSESDALSSAANFLRSLGWKSGYIWGREVTLADNFDYQLAGREQQYTLSQWTDYGVSRVDGTSLGDSQLKASLLVPAGHKGPAFLVYENFNVIMRWNFSESYALAVGYLADRIAGKKPLSTPVPSTPDYPVDRMRKIQAALNELGFNVGEVDGVFGPATRKGLQMYQASIDRVADGFPDTQTVELLLAALTDAT